MARFPGHFVRLRKTIQQKFSPLLIQFQYGQVAHKFIRKKGTIAVNTLYKAVRITEDKTRLQQEIVGLQKGAPSPPSRSETIRSSCSPPKPQNLDSGFPSLKIILKCEVDLKKSPCPLQTPRKNCILNHPRQDVKHQWGPHNSLLQNPYKYVKTMRPGLLGCLACLHCPKTLKLVTLPLSTVVLHQPNIPQIYRKDECHLCKRLPRGQNAHPQKTTK